MVDIREGDVWNNVNRFALRAVLEDLNSVRTNHPVSRDGCHPSLSKEGTLPALRSER